VPGAVVLHREGIEDVVLSKRRFTYEQQLSENPLNYDAWFDYIKLEESTGNVDRIREVSSQCRCTIVTHRHVRSQHEWHFLAGSEPLTLLARAALYLD
jgi:crooked neck